MKFFNAAEDINFVAILGFAGRHWPPAMAIAWQAKNRAISSRWSAA
jgi:hypothetical protein